MAESFKDKMEGDVACRLAFVGTVSVRSIKTGVRFIMTGEKGPKRVDYGAFAHIVWAYQHIQSLLKFQLGVTQFAKVLDRQLSEVHERLHPCFADQILLS
jgi:hypothetical protein